MPLKKKTLEQFIIDAKKVHGDLFEYNNTIYYSDNSNLVITCRVHGDFIQKANNHLNGATCLKCVEEKWRKERTKPFEKFEEDANKKHNHLYEYVKETYVNSRTKMSIICKIHGEFSQSPVTHLIGNGCPNCKTSKGENNIEQWLSKKGINFIKQKRFKDCKNKKPLPFDFYLPDHNICIEYDGEQHFKPVRFNGICETKAKKIYDLNIVKDHIKTVYCLDKGITLIRMDYTNYNELELILERTLYERKN